MDWIHIHSLLRWLVRHIKIKTQTQTQNEQQWLIRGKKTLYQVWIKSLEKLPFKKSKIEPAGVPGPTEDSQPHNDSSPLVNSIS